MVRGGIGQLEKKTCRYLGNDPKRGVMNNLSPDVVAIRHGFLPYIFSGAARQGIKSNLGSTPPGAGG